MIRRRYLLVALALAASTWGDASARPATGAAPAAHGEHQLSVYAGGGGLLYMSSARTQGGFGGGLGVRDTLRDRYILQADLTYLTFFGSVGSVRLGAGVQRSGTWRPALLLTLTTLFGDSFSFLTAEHPSPIHRPAITLGVSLAPARFAAGATQISLFELGIGAAPEFPGLGLSYQLQLLEVSAALPF